MDSRRRDYRVFLLYSTVYRPQRRLILHVTYCLPMYLRSVSRVMVRMYVCSLVDVWAARLVIMDKPSQLRTVRRYDSDAYVGVWVWLLFFFFENLLLNNNKISVFQNDMFINTYLPT